MKTHSIKVTPYSGAETRFMELLHLNNIEDSSIECRLGIIFGTSYNEYLFGDDIYNKIKNYLLESGAH